MFRGYKFREYDTFMEITWTRKKIFIGKGMMMISAAVLLNINKDYDEHTNTMIVNAIAIMMMTKMDLKEDIQRRGAIIIIALNDKIIF